MKYPLSTLLLSVSLVFAACNPTQNDPTPEPDRRDYGVEISPAAPSWDGTKSADISYQVLVYSFADSDGDGIGDFKGLEDKLSYFDEIGVSALWLSPVHPASSYHGYDVLDYEAINSEYGTEEDFKSLIDAAHEHGIKIYMDYVINHTGKDHPWFKAALSSEDNPYREYYVLSSNPQADIAAGKIPQISTEGAGGYDSGQWYAATVNSSDDARKLKFTLDWSTPSAPKLTVSKVDDVVNSGEQSSGKYLYYGEGNIKEFYTDGSDIYTLGLELTTSWGVLVRTSTTTWDGGTKFGAPTGSNKLDWDTPLTLSTSDAQDILLPDQASLMYHSHFWTPYFADLNYGYADQCASSPAFKAIVASAQKWMDLGVDGFRMDGAKHIYHNASSSENPTFWNTFYTTLNTYFHKTHSEDLYMVGEVYDDWQAASPYYKGLPAIFEFAFWYRLQWAIGASTGRYFANDIMSYRTHYEGIRPDYIAAMKLSNHDEDRALSTLGGKNAIDKAKLAGAVLFTAEGSPYVYYGEELGYLGKKNNGDEFVRSPFKWGDSYTTNYVTKLFAGQADVATYPEQKADGSSIWNVYKTFGTLRNACPALAEGVMERHGVYNETNGDFPSLAVWYMNSGSQKLLVVHNLSAKVVSAPFEDSLEKPLAVQGKAYQQDNVLTLSAWSSAVFEL